MIFYVFYSSFSLHDSLENVFYEQLEWLKFQKSVPPQIPIWGGGGGGGGGAYRAQSTTVRKFS